MLKCAFYEKEITPPLECEITGYFTPRAATGVKDRLYAKAAVFENDDEAVAFVSVDATGLHEELCNKIAGRIERLCGIPYQNIMIMATHSHTSLPTGDSTIIASDEMYLDVFCRLAADCVVLACQRLKPATLKYAKGCVENLAFVRNFRMKDGTVKTNPGYNNPEILEPYDKSDPDFPFLVAYDESGKALGMISNFACHLDCVQGYEYSGDFPAYLSLELKGRFGKDFVSLFMLGTAGNVVESNPLGERKKPDHYKWMGKVLAEEIFNKIDSTEEIKNPVISATKDMIVAKRRWPSEEELKDEYELAAKKEIIDAQSTDRSLGVCYRGYIAERMVHYVKDKRKTRKLILQVIKIGDISFFSFPGEVYVSYGRDIKKGADTDKVFIASLANTSVGYFPTADLFGEKKMYECHITSAPFEPETGNLMVKKLLEMQ